MDVRELELQVNTSEFFKASATYYTSGEATFNGFKDQFSEPTQIDSLELDNGQIAIVWAVDIWKEYPVSASGWDSDYDLFYRVLDPVSGLFVTEEVRVTDTLGSEYLKNISSDGAGGFNITYGDLDEDDTQSYDTLAKVNYDELDGYQYPTYNIDIPEHEVVSGKLFWNITNGSDGLVSQLEVNTSEFFKASATYYTSGEATFNGFKDQFSEPTQIDSLELDNGQIAIVWAVDIWKEYPVSASGWDSDYDLFYRVLDPVSGLFVTEEVRVTDTLGSEYLKNISSDGAGGFNITYGDLDEDDTQSSDMVASIVANNVGGYQNPTYEMDIPQFETLNGQLFWNWIDEASGLSTQLEINSSLFQKGSSTNGNFNGLNEALVEPNQVLSLSLENSHIVVVWAMDNWKEHPESGWNSNYDLFYRVLDPISGLFVTEETRLNDNFKSDYLKSVVPDSSGGFSLIWDSEGNFESQTVRYSESTNSYENISGNVILGDNQDGIYFGTNDSDFAFLGKGDDIIEGGAGSDLLYGGAGEDTAVFSGAASEYEIVRDGIVVYVTETTTGDVDHVEGFELLQFGDGTTMNIGYEVVSGRFW